MSIMPVKLSLARKKFNFTGCAAVLSELFFVKTKQQISGNTLCITGDFCEVWAEKGRLKPILPYLNPPKGQVFYFSSIAAFIAFAVS